MTQPDLQLRKFATDAQWKYFLATAEHGSAEAAARALGLSGGTVRGGIERVKSKAARQGYAPEYDMTRAVPDGFHLKGTSTLYDESGAQRMQWVKTSIDQERQAELFREAVEAMAEDLPRVEPKPKDESYPSELMSVIPFGAVGAILGHWFLGYQLMFFSALGIVALSGVVVNASLVLVDYINRRRREGMPLEEAVLSAGVVRFRPILLTSVTTFVGLVPLMSSPSPATSFFIPMAISLAFGVLFATFITLFLVPALYRIAEDFFGWDPVAQGQSETTGLHDLHPQPQHHEGRSSAG